MLDADASDVYDTHGQHLRRFPYRCVSEIIALMCVTTLRDVLFFYDADANAAMSAEFVDKVSSERQQRIAPSV